MLAFLKTNRWLALLFGLNEFTGIWLLVQGCMIAAKLNNYKDADVDLGIGFSMLFIVPALYIMLSTNTSALFAAFIGLKDREKAYGVVAGLSALAIAGLCIAHILRVVILVDALYPNPDEYVCDIPGDCTVYKRDEACTDDCCVTNDTINFCGDGMELIHGGYLVIWITLVISIITFIVASIAVLNATIKNKCLAFMFMLNEVGGFLLLVTGCFAASQLNKYKKSDVVFSNSFSMVFIVPSLYIMLSSTASLFAALKDKTRNHGIVAAFSALAFVGLCIAQVVHTVFYFDACGRNCTVYDENIESCNDDCCVTQTAIDFCGEGLKREGLDAINLAGHVSAFNLCASLVTFVTACVYCCCKRGSNVKEPKLQTDALQTTDTVPSTVGIAVKCDDEEAKDSSIV